jgi:thiosulfate dehydrogenase [quinone] large subunit
MKKIKQEYIAIILRIAIGFIFLWAFFDKIFGLGFNTAPDKSWLAGNSPTAGFLKFAARGPLSDIFHWMSGSVFVDWIFMLGLFFVGITLIIGIMVRLGSLIGSLMLFLMYLALIPPKDNPFIDSHIIYALVLLLFAASDNNECCGFIKKWSELKIVKKFPILK